MIYARQYDIDKAVQHKKWPPIWAVWLRHMDAVEADTVIEVVLGYIPGIADRMVAVRAADGCSSETQYRLSIMLDMMEEEYQRSFYRAGIRKTKNRTDGKPARNKRRIGNGRQ